MHHPWRLLRSLTDWTLHWREFSDDTLGETDWSTRTVTLDARLRQVERRCTIAHELVHIERGPFPAWCESREEAAVEQEAARRLIALDDLLDALRWARDEHEAADQLWVTPDILRTRLGHLHPTERHYLHRHLEGEA